MAAVRTAHGRWPRETSCAFLRKLTLDARRHGQRQPGHAADNWPLLKALELDTRWPRHGSPAPEHTELKDRVAKLHERPSPPSRISTSRPDCPIGREDRPSRWRAVRRWNPSNWRRTFGKGSACPRCPAPWARCSVLRPHIHRRFAPSQLGSMLLSGRDDVVLPSIQTIAWCRCACVCCVRRNSGAGRCEAAPRHRPHFCRMRSSMAPPWVSSSAGRHRRATIIGCTRN